MFTKICRRIPILVKVWPKERTLYMMTYVRSCDSSVVMETDRVTVWGTGWDRTNISHKITAESVFCLRYELRPKKRKWTLNPLLICVGTFHRQWQNERARNGTECHFVTRRSGSHVQYHCTNKRVPVRDVLLVCGCRNRNLSLALRLVWHGWLKCHIHYKILPYSTCNNPFKLIMEMRLTLYMESNLLEYKRLILRDAPYSFCEPYFSWKWFSATVACWLHE